MSNIQYFLPMFERLAPRTPWAGGRMTDTDVLTLADAASMATKHAGEPVTIGDFLRAAARGEITLRAIVHRTTKVQKHDGGIYCNGGQENENKVPAGAIATLPLTACRHLAGTGRASWRTFDGFEMVDGVLQRYTKGRVLPDEPDFETLPDDCRVVGYDVHALADEYTSHDAQQAAPQAAVSAPVTDSASNAPACDLSILATREQLIEAFGRFTGMDASWFKNIKDTPALLAARKVTGQGGRGHIAEPWFCPFEVMQWLADSKRRKGRKLSTEKAWELLEKNFPKVHSAHSVADPRASD